MADPIKVETDVQSAVVALDRVINRLSKLSDSFNAVSKSLRSIQAAAKSLERVTAASKKAVRIPTAPNFTGPREKLKQYEELLRQETSRRDKIGRFRRVDPERVQDIKDRMSALQAQIDRPQLAAEKKAKTDAERAAKQSQAADRKAQSDQAMAARKQQQDAARAQRDAERDRKLQERLKFGAAFTGPRERMAKLQARLDDAKSTGAPQERIDDLTEAIDSLRKSIGNNGQAFPGLSPQTNFLVQQLTAVMRATGSSRAAVAINQMAGYYNRHAKSAGGAPPPTPGGGTAAAAASGGVPGFLSKMRVGPMAIVAAIVVIGKLLMWAAQKLREAVGRVSERMKEYQAAAATIGTAEAKVAGGAAKFGMEPETYAQTVKSLRDAMDPMKTQDPLVWKALGRLGQGPVLSPAMGGPTDSAKVADKAIQAYIRLSEEERQRVKDVVPAFEEIEKALRESPGLREFRERRSDQISKRTQQAAEDVKKFNATIEEVKSSLMDFWDGIGMGFIKTFNAISGAYTKSFRNGSAFFPGPAGGKATTHVDPNTRAVRENTEAIDRQTRAYQALSGFHGGGSRLRGAYPARLHGQLMEDGLRMERLRLGAFKL